MKTVHASEYAVQMKHCCKSFGRVVANDNVDLRLKWGEIHALLGENGSGKTTLVNMLSGIYQPDDGEIWVDGNQAVIDSPKTAYQLGIGMIHQHFMLVDVLSATENIILGQKGGVLLNRRKVSAEICAMIDQYGFHIDPNRKISEMSVSEKQTVEIIKLNGSIELAPIVGLSEVIVDIVETGSTLRENGLTVLEEVCDLSARMVVNQVSMKMEHERIAGLIGKLKALIQEENR